MGGCPLVDSNDGTASREALLKHLTKSEGLHLSGSGDFDRAIALLSRIGLLYCINPSAATESLQFRITNRIQRPVQWTASHAPAPISVATAKGHVLQCPDDPHRVIGRRLMRSEENGF